MVPAPKDTLPNPMLIRQELKVNVEEFQAGSPGAPCAAPEPGSLGSPTLTPALHGPCCV